MFLNTGIFRSILCRSLYQTCILPERNTFIVKRAKPPPISKARAVRKRILKGRHFVYETVENTDLTDPPDLHVVLTSFVDGIGDVGDVISIMPFHGREHLLLPRKAVYATPENIEKYALIKKNRPEKPKYSSIHAGKTIECLSKYVIPVFMSPEVPWTIEKSHIHIAFRQENFLVPEETIEIPAILIDGPDPLKESKDFAVFITINNTEKFPVRCRLFHIKPGMEAEKLSNDLYLEKEDPILIDQKELLDQMPTPVYAKDPEANVSLVEKYRIQYIK